MKKLILIVITLLTGATQVQAMSNKLFTGVAATAGAAAIASGLGWYYNNSKQAGIQTQLDTLREELSRLAQAKRANSTARSNHTLTDAERNDLQEEYERLNEEYNIAFTNYSAQFSTLERQRLQAVSSAYNYKQGMLASTAIGTVMGIKAGVVTPLTAALPTVIAGTAHQVYMHRAATADIAQATELYETAQNCKYAMLAGGATALCAASAQYVPNALSAASDILGTTITATKVGVGLAVLAGTIAVGMKVVPPVMNTINRVRSIASWFGA